MLSLDLMDRMWSSRPLNRIRDILRPSFPRARSQPTSGQPTPILPQDFSPADRELLRLVQPFTMTGPERIFHLARSVEYVVRNRVPGSFVECGVWRGGSMMCVAHTLLRLGATDVDLYLFDTYDGMPAPEAVDRLHDGTPAAQILTKSRKDSLNWAYTPLEEVRQNLARTGYPLNRLHFVAGKVEDTIPERAPQEISLLRLDTDWYSSTRHELIHLYPRLRTHGVLIIDDYGWWQGARRAVDEYFGALDLAPLLHRIDETARGCIKLSGTLTDAALPRPC